jgi:Uma2 family endonuclease
MMIHEPVTIERAGMSMEDFIRQFEAAPFELIDGKVITLVPALTRHNVLIALLYELLIAHRSSASIEVFFEMAFVPSDSSDWVEDSRVPGIMVYDKGRFEAYTAANPDWLDKPLLLIPDLCIEIVSKNDTMTDVMSKVEHYLADGVRAVWVFEPKTRTVTLRTVGSQQALILRAADTLDGGGIVRGFSVVVGDVLG